MFFSDPFWVDWIPQNMKPMNSVHPAGVRRNSVTLLSCLRQNNSASPLLKAVFRPGPTPPIVSKQNNTNVCMYCFATDISRASSTLRLRCAYQRKGVSGLGSGSGQLVNQTIRFWERRVAARAQLK